MAEPQCAEPISVERRTVESMTEHGRETEREREPERVSGAENVAERAENRVKRSGAMSGRDRKRWSGVRNRPRRSCSVNGVESTGERADESTVHRPLQPNISLT